MLLVRSEQALPLTPATSRFTFPFFPIVILISCISVGLLVFFPRVFEYQGLARRSDDQEKAQAGDGHDAARPGFTGVRDDHVQQPSRHA